MEYFRVVNFEKYQHYKKRSPPWIKLHRRVLQNYKIGKLPDATKAHIFSIWVLASEHNNVLPWDDEWILRKINANSKVDLELLESVKLIEKIRKTRKRSASKTLAPKTETEGETEGETEAKREREKRKEKEPKKEKEKKVQNLSFLEWRIGFEIALEEFKPGVLEWIGRQDKNLVVAAFEKTHALDSDFGDINSRHGFFVYQLKKLIKEKRS